MDSDLGNGMAIGIGRIEACPVMGVKFFCLAHNTIRGAAGAAIANAELLVAGGYLK
jgi:aspartate-semialdehyde dehydrogenase